METECQVNPSLPSINAGTSSLRLTLSGALHPALKGGLGAAEWVNTDPSFWSLSFLFKPESQQDFLI